MKKLLALLALHFVCSFPALAAQDACSGHFYGGQAPVVVNAKMRARLTPVCYTGYAVAVSGVTRTPLWSAEHLTRANLMASKTVQRVDDFHPDPSVPPEDRAQLSDYRRSGFDRGHMSPSADMPTPRAQDESFSLANIVPQNPDNNRGLWAGIEGAVRDLAKRRGELYVVTGPLFVGNTLQQIHGRVLVPTRLFKLVYDPVAGRAAAYVTDNATGSRYEVMSLNELNRLAGIDLLPAVTAGRRTDLLTLPGPRERASHGRHAHGHRSFFGL